MKKNFVIVCVSNKTITKDFKEGLKKALSDLSINPNFKIESETHLQLELSENSFNHELLDSSLVALAALHQVDVGLIPKEIFETPKKLVIFDMDSTLITSEVIDEMALVHGVGEKVKLITKRAMNGELNFDQSLTERVALLKGFDRSHMETILKNLKFTPGTEEFIQTLRSLGIKTAIASGGFQYFAKSIQTELQIDYVFANELEFENNKLTGRVTSSIVNAEAKEKIVQGLAQTEGLSLNEIVTIGDGANDIPMLLKAGLGIAIHAKEKVQKVAKYRINFGPMTHALSFMNIKEKK